MYLLDTPIVFDLRRARERDVAPGLALWAGQVARERLFVSSITLVELEAAATDAARRDKAAGAALRKWIDESVVRAFEGNILPLDLAVARRRGQIGLSVTRDALFAATALEHGLTLVTRNGAAFKAARVRVLDPTTYQPEEDADWRTAGRTRAAWLRDFFVRS
ncbi:PIN domain-containing protein [Sphingomonas sp. CJ20]